MASATEQPNGHGYSLFDYDGRPAFFSFDGAQMAFNIAPMATRLPLLTSATTASAKRMAS
ncbi:hypothetical protein KDL29_02275 [bacterium]|nr:hypothetical protein [bacterium]